MRFQRALLFVIAAAVTAPAFAVDWSDPRSVVAAAVDSNPTLLRLQTEVSAARERVRPASAHPNPMLMAGVQNKEIDLRDDEMMTMYMVGAQQTFTNRGRRNARRSAAELDVRAAEQQVLAARAEIEREALLAWYDIAAADSQAAAAEQVRTLIEAIIGAARVRYEVGTGIQAEVIRAQLERSAVEHQILRLHGARNAAVARLLPLLGLSADASIPRLNLPASTARRAIEPLPVSLDDHPALAAAEAEVARQDQLLELARLARRPDISLEASYGHRPTQTDMFSVVASIELPVRRNSIIEPQIREAVARREAAARRAEEIRRDLVRALAVAAAVHEQANDQLRLQEEVLVPQSRLAFDSTLAAYQTGRVPFEGVLAAESAYLQAQLDYYEFLAQHIKAVVDFEAIRSGATTSVFASPAAASGRSSRTPAGTAASMGGM